MALSHRKSFISYALTAIAGAAILVLVLIVSPFESDGANLLSAFLLVPFTFLTAGGIGAVVDQRETEKDLNLLYEDLDPETFLVAFEPVADRMKSTSFIEASIHMAEGLIASGDGLIARKIIDSTRNRAIDLDSILTLALLQLRCSLIAGDRGKIEHDTHKLRDAIKGMRTLPEELEKRIKEEAEPYMEAAETGSVAGLRRLFDRTDKKLKKVELSYLIAVYGKDEEMMKWYEENRNKVSYK